MEINIRKGNSMNRGEIIIYQTPSGETQLDVRLENETVWLTQAQMSVLFQRERTVITKHVRNIFAEGRIAGKCGMCKFCTYHST